MRKIERISISVADRERLERLVRERNTPQKVVWRARIVLLAGDGLTAEGIAVAVGKSLLTVRRWRRRYVAKGVDGLLKDATRRSRVKPLTPEKIAGEYNTAAGKRFASRADKTRIQSPGCRWSEIRTTYDNPHRTGVHGHREHWMHAGGIGTLGRNTLSFVFQKTCRRSASQSTSATIRHAL
jgi:hypothetical protein